MEKIMKKDMEKKIYMVIVGFFVLFHSYQDAAKYYEWVAGIPFFVFPGILAVAGFIVSLFMFFSKASSQMMESRLNIVLGTSVFIFFVLLTFIMGKINLEEVKVLSVLMSIFIFSISSLTFFSLFKVVQLSWLGRNQNDVYKIYLYALIRPVYTVFMLIVIKVALSGN